METFLLLTFAGNTPEFSCGFPKIACDVEGSFIYLLFLLVNKEIVLAF